jgi:hypothetical protein
MAFLNFTSLTLDEFQPLVPPFEAALHTRMAAWRMDGTPRTARRFPVYNNCPLPTPEARLLFILGYLKTYALQVVHGRLFGRVQGKAHQWIHVLLPALLAALCALGAAPARSLSALAQRRRAGGGARSCSSHSSRRAGLPPFAQDGTNRRIVRPQAPPQHAVCDSGKNKDYPVKNVLLVHALLVILLLSDPHGGRVHDLRLAEPTPYPLPAGRGLLQELGVLAFPLPEVEPLMPTKKPRGAELSLEQHQTTQALHQRRRRIEHVSSRVQRWRIVKDRSRLWKPGGRDRVMERCCALHNFRVRLLPWQPMV